MSLTNPTNAVTEQDLKDFYDSILPYLGGSADAGFTPIGTVISVMGVTAPANYLICDGTVYNIADYPELANYFNQQFGSKNKFGGNGTTTFAVPDLRGEFLRGTGTNSHTGNGNGAAVGTHQDATDLPYEWMNIKTSRGLSRRYDDEHITTDGNYTYPYQYPDSTKSGTNQKQIKISDTTNEATAASSNVTSFTARPTNTSVLYCIATKNIYLNPSLDYSTDEKVVGTWIDGKPLYQKTIIVKTPTVATAGTNVTNTYILSELGISNSDAVMIESAFIMLSNAGTCVNFSPFYATNTGQQIKTVISMVNIQKVLQMICGIMDYSDKNAYVTLQYTKTTD